MSPIRITIYQETMETNHQIVFTPSLLGHFRSTFVTMQYLFVLFTCFLIAGAILSFLSFSMMLSAWTLRNIIFRHGSLQTLHRYQWAPAVSWPPPRSQRWQSRILWRPRPCPGWSLSASRCQRLRTASEALTLLWLSWYRQQKPWKVSCYY